MAEYTADIQHLPGVENIEADALSRPLVVAAIVLPASTGLLNWAQLATAQSTCKDLATMHARWLHHLVSVQVEGFPVWCDVSTWVWQLVVPQNFRQQVFDAIHGLAHPGVHASTCLVSDRFVWPGLATDVKKWSRQADSLSSQVQFGKLSKVGWVEEVYRFHAVPPYKMWADIILKERRTFFLIVISGAMSKMFEFFHFVLGNC